MSKKELESFKKRIDVHFKSEVLIMNDILESGLTKEESRELTAYMKNCEWAKLIDKVTNWK